ncbi:MAG: glutamate-5-semialdehyde dehydrogenase [Clostridia bacterium]|nr:glutamate-5-semialdehyde dehydrogenase [Clostridia bacterium]
MISVRENCILAKQSAPYVAALTTEDKNNVLRIIADALIQNAQEIIDANKVDLANNSEKPKHILDRLMLDESRIKSMSVGLEKLISLPDPVGEVVDESVNYAGLLIKRVRVPLGVIGIIYEARPNVTVDAIGLCVKTGNAVVLRGSRDAVESNKAIISVIGRVLNANNYRSDFIQLILDLSHESSNELMKARGLVDVLIPRGSARLINAVVENSTVPVIETGTGNCHAYVHETANIEMAKTLILNGKLRRPSVCNATESILVDEAIAERALKVIIPALQEKGVTVYGCEKTRGIVNCEEASEEDFYTEYLDLKISCKVVKDYKEAVAHVNKYSSSHSESIICEDETAKDYFIKYVDSAAVYHNVSTAFTDGFEFGLGAEMGISTQKLHARGPLGLRELTSTKYCVYGNGQTRK